MRLLVVVILILLVVLTSACEVTEGPREPVSTPFPTLYPSPTPPTPPPTPTPKPEQMVTIGKWKALTLRNLSTNATLLIERTEFVKGNKHDGVLLDAWVTWNGGRIRRDFKVDQSATLSGNEGVRVLAKSEGFLEVYYTNEWYALSIKSWP